MPKPINEIARELLDSEHNNGWGIQAGALQAACKKYQVEFSDLFQEICNESHKRDQELEEEGDMYEESGM